MKLPPLFTIAFCLFLLGVRAEAAEQPSEKSQAAAILAGKSDDGIDPKFAAAVRRIDQLGGKLEFDARGRLVGVDLAADRVSAADADLPHLSALPNVERLRLSGGGITNEGAKLIGSMSRLVLLSTLDAQIDDVGVAQLAALKNLRSLSIRRSPALTDNCLKHLRRLPKLASLGLLDVNITDRGLEQLADFSQLRLLDLRGCAQVSGEGLKKIGALKNLKTLRLGGSRIDDTVLEIVGKFAGLTGLTIDEAGITDAGLERLADLPLEEISFSRCYGITDDGLRRLGGFKHLRQLSLRGIPITGEGLAHLRGAGALADLRLNETGVGDDALNHLAGLTHLARLELRQTLVTDAAVEYLAKLAALRSLDVRETAVTPSGMKRLGERLPKCKIVGKK